MATLPPLAGLRLGPPTAATLPELPSELWQIVLNAIDDENPCQAVQTLCRTNRLFPGWCAEDGEGGIFDRLNLRLGSYGELANWAAVKAHYENPATMELQPYFEPDVPAPATPKAYFAKVCRLRAAIESGAYSEIPNDVDPKWVNDPEYAQKWWKERYPETSVKQWYKRAEDPNHHHCYGYMNWEDRDNPGSSGRPEPFYRLAMEWLVTKDPRNIAAMDLLGSIFASEKEKALQREIIEKALWINPEVLEYVPYKALGESYFNIVEEILGYDPYVIEYVPKPYRGHGAGRHYSIPPNEYFRLVAVARAHEPTLVRLLQHDGKIPVPRRKFTVEPGDYSDWDDSDNPDE
jgi:hypothetical protein